MFAALKGSQFNFYFLKSIGSLKRLLIICSLLLKDLSLIFISRFKSLVFGDSQSRTSVALYIYFVLVASFTLLHIRNKNIS